jgi:hypothetical protein
MSAAAIILTGGLSTGGVSMLIYNKVRQSRRTNVEVENHLQRNVSSNIKSSTKAANKI